ncbi:MAG: enoyl-CoA hydratase [Bacteroidetes bacterium]|nr:enoyl-CoA hydratase [Bacteroidota bacterium]
MNQQNWGSFKTLLGHLEESVLTLTINRPDKMNALNQTVLSELAQVIEQLEQDQNVKGVIITGAGEKAFVAGADISEFNGADLNRAMEIASKGQAIFDRLEKNNKPIIAAVNGFALGGGCELAMACHIRIAAEQARFGQPEVNLGLIPGYGGTQRLTQLVGRGKALELMMSGNMIDASQALQIGLVNYVVNATALMAESKKLMRTILTKGPQAVARVIQAVEACFDKTKNGYRNEVTLFGQCFGTAEMQEGVSAFLEKRKPKFN